ncbi:MAG: xylose isomerase [Paenibacillus sp.]|jgi:sugar phosphate isomerase/epimerase|nr:xylose isomerase [Paenibacillus sp.]
MITLTGFSDEISSDLDMQLHVLDSLGIKHLELRGVWGKNVLDLSVNEAAEIKENLDKRGFRVSAIASPIGKIKITDDFGPHLEQFERALDLAIYFGAPFIRIFSFYIADKQYDEHRDEVFSRIQAIIQIAASRGIVLLHENESHIYGDTGVRCLDLLQSCESPNWLAAFDPANFVQCGVRPMTEAYPLLEPFIAYVHVKDALAATGQVVPAGRGDGQLRELIAALKAKGYEGYFSIEPHLAAHDPYKGRTGPELFEVAAKALQELLREANVEWK